VTDARIRVLVVDDHPVVRQGLVALLEGPGIEVVGEAANGVEAVAAFTRLHPDVTLMDVRMPGMSGVEAITIIRRLSPEARVIVLTTYDGDAWVKRALEAGAAGFLLKDTAPGRITEVVRIVRDGGRYIPPELAAKMEHRGPELTPREQEVLSHLVRGLRNREIGAELGVAEATVKLHVNAILGKLGAKDRTEAAAIALRRGLVSL
jgi:two-component system NarL family response regulator